MDLDISEDTSPMTPDDLHAPTPPPRRRLLAARTATAITAGGLLFGGLIGGYVISNAATSSTPSATPSSGGSSSPGAPSGMSGGPHGGMGLPDSGTVTAVGSNSVTIDGKVYAVTASSDIDKNGEAKLSDLAVGDKVTFSTDSSASTPTIRILHAGDESLDRPSGPPPNGTPPSGAPMGG